MFILNTNKISKINFLHKQSKNDIILYIILKAGADIVKTKDMDDS